MSKAALCSLFSLLAVSLGSSFQACATTVTIGATAPADYISTTFLAGNTASGPGVWTFAGGAITADTNIPDTVTPTTCLDPLGSGTGTTAYYACSVAGSTITADFAGGITGFDLLWGSPDGYNTLTFYTGLDGTGTAESFIPGVAPLITMAPVPEDPVLFVAAPGTVWESVTFTSAVNSFEFANVATLAAVPEPSILALLVGGFLLIVAGAALRRRKSASVLLP